MRRCEDCGRLTIFLKFDRSSGLCDSCREKRRFAAQAAAEERVRAWFEKADSIPAAEIRTDGERVKKNNLSEITDLPISPITTRINRAQLGTVVCIDIETTGLHVGSGKIVEVGAVKYEDWEPVEAFCTLINPKSPIPAEASEINHITDDMVAGAPEFYHIIPSLSDFIGNHSLLGHNIMFDLKFLYKNGYDFTAVKRKYYDLLPLAQRKLKYGEDIDNHQLDTLCAYFHIPRERSHRALYDCCATMDVLSRLLEAF